MGWDRSAMVFWPCACGFIHQRQTTPEMVADAAKAFKPKILYPYHTGDTDVSKIGELLKDTPHLITVLVSRQARGRIILTAVGKPESDAMLDRQRAGVAKAQGRYKGRVPTARRKADEIALGNRCPAGDRPDLPLSMKSVVNVRHSARWGGVRPA